MGRKGAFVLRCESCQWRTERVYKPFDSILGRSDGFGKCAKCGGKMSKHTPMFRRAQR